MDLQAYNATSHSLRNELPTSALDTKTFDKKSLRTTTSPTQKVSLTTNTPHQQA